MSFFLSLLHLFIQAKYVTELVLCTNTCSSSVVSVKFSY